MMNAFLSSCLLLNVLFACKSTEVKQAEEISSVSFDDSPDSPYEFRKVPHAEIDKYLVPGSDATKTPEALQGIFWLDSDSLADVAITFANVKFRETKDKKTNAIVHEGYLAVFDEGVWSWDDSKKGSQAYFGVGFSKLYYHLRFNEDFSLGVITPNFSPLPRLPRVEIPPSFLVEVLMRKATEDEYTRETIILGKQINYRFRRIVDGKGNRLPVYDEYLSALKRRGLVHARVPKCRNNAESALPTSCAYPLPYKF